MFIYKRKGIEIEPETLKKLYKENSFRAFYGVRRDDEYKEFSFEKELKFDNKEELADFLSKDSEVAGEFSYASSNFDKDTIELYEDHYFCCKEIDVIKSDAHSLNTLTFLKERVFKDVDKEVVIDLIKSLLKSYSKKVCFYADLNTIDFYDTEKLLKEEKGVLYDSLDFLKEKTAYYGTTNTNHTTNHASAVAERTVVKAKVVSKYSFEVKSRIVELLLKQMVTLPEKDSSKSRNAIKAYVNTLNDDKFDSLINFYKIRAIN